MIRGKWGCGKSWLIKDYMDKHKEYEYLYVSLYGMTSYKEIEDSFFEQIHSVLSSKGMKSCTIHLVQCHYADLLKEATFYKEIPGEGRCLGTLHVKTH